MPLPNYDRDREKLCELVGDCVFEIYRKWYYDGGTEPVLTARRVQEWLNRSGRMPGRFRSQPDAKQLQSVRSALRTEANGGRVDVIYINSGTATERIAYTPCRIHGETWGQFFGTSCKVCGRWGKVINDNGKCDGCTADTEPEGK